MTGWRKASIVAWLALPLLAWGCWLLSVHQWARVPNLSDWAAAADVVRRGAQPGDMVLFAPAWAQEGAGAFRGLDVWTSEVVDWYEIGRHPRVWVVGAMGHREPAIPDGFTRATFEDLGRVTVTLLESPLSVPVFDFKARLSNGEVVYGYPDGAFVATTYADRRWKGRENPDWCYVGAIDRDIGGGIRNAIWAHPPNQNVPLTVRYRNVPPGRTLVVHYGMAQSATEEGQGVPVTFEILFGDRVMVERSINGLHTFWNREVIDLSDVGPWGGEVAFRLRTADHNHQHFMFTADLWDDHPGRFADLP